MNLKIMAEEKRIYELETQLRKSRAQCEVLQEWIYSAQLGRPIKGFFHKHNLKNIAIYGDGDIGLLFCQELIHTSDINICCFIDRRKRENPFGIPNVQQYDLSLNAEIIVVTVLTEYESIREKLIREGADYIISLADVIKEA